MEIDCLTFDNFKNCIKEGYQSDLDISYIINRDNNNILRTIKTQQDFELFIQEITESYENQPNKNNQIEANLLIKLRDKRPKVRRNCINCKREMEIELDIDEKKLIEMNDLTNIDNLNNFNKLINESNELCEECEKYILEDAKNKINIGNSINNINNLSGINQSSLNLNPNNTYQNILANNYRNNILNNNTNILSTALLNRTLNTVIGLNDIKNKNNNLFGINNISNINPTTPRRNNTIFSDSLINNINNNLFSPNITNYDVNGTNLFP
jgi:hypothetical protein